MFFRPVSLLLLGCFSVFPAWLPAQQMDIETANIYFNTSFFKEAIPLYEQAIELGHQGGQVHLRLAECYKFVNNPAEAAKWYPKALAYTDNKRSAYDYAQILMMLGRYEEAKQWATRAAQAGDTARGYRLANSCEFARRQTDAPTQALFEIQNLEALNTKSADFAPSFHKGQLLYASSRSVPVEKGKEITWTNDAFNQYYQAIAPDAEKPLEWAQGKPLRNFIGKDINDAPISFSKAGDFVAITSNNFMDGIRHIEGSGMMMDIYLYEALSAQEWKQGTELFFPHNASVEESMPFSTGQPALNGRGDALYFSSNRPGGMGGYDIYVSYRSSKGGWSIPKNLGFPINTPGNEMTPFICADANGQNERLFFSSDLHPGFGGLDVFTSERLPYGWAVPQNLGKSINSGYDDNYFIYDPARRFAVFTSNREGGKGNEDLYFGKQLRAFDGQQRKGIQIGEQIALYSIQYTDGDELVFSPEEHQRIYDMLAALNDNPDVLLQIHAFADTRGSDATNLSTTQKRARLLAQYFVNNNISRQRISFAGYGEAYPINQCVNGANCSDRDHSLNRRVEITFVGRFDASGTPALEYDATPDARPSTRKNYINPYTRTRPRPVGAASTFNANSKSSYPTDGKTVGVIVEPSKVLSNPNLNPNPVVNPKPNPPTPPARDNRSLDSKTKTTPPPPPAVSSRKPVRKEHYAINDKIDIANIYYDLNRASFDEKNSPGLKEILEVLIDQPYITIEIGAHTDSNGEDAYNRELSQKRADAVRNYLIKKGIPANRLTAKGYGESKLVNNCKDGVKCSDEEHAKNRRTEFVVTGQKGFKVGDIIQVASINYAKSSTTLDKDSEGLKEIIALLKGNNISVEIRSHTDSNGSATHNLEVSQKRAKAVFDYLVKSGIPASRLKYKGYGETMLINKCKDGVKCSDAEHEQNRRTDFKVIGLK